MAAPYGAEAATVAQSNGIKITSTDGAAYDSFGSAVALSNTRLAVGAHFAYGNAPSSGAAYHFAFDTVGVSAVPLPATGALLLSAVGLLALGRRRVA